jgi:hypothetical protein
MILSQTPWLATALLTLDATGSAAGSSAFPTDLDAPGDLAPIVLGFGFWQPANQIGVGGVAAFAVAAFLVATAAVGVRWSTGADRWPLVALGLVGLVIAVASGLPDIDRAFERLTELAPFTAVREGQRMAALLVFVVTVFAARGLTMATRENRAAAVGAGVALGGSAILLVGGSLWGLDGRIDPVPLPESWNRASRIVERAPGPTLALPWNQFFDLDVADGRRTHHPVPICSSTPAGRNRAIRASQPFPPSSIGSSTEAMSRSTSTGSVYVGSSFCPTAGATSKLPSPSSPASAG